MIDIHERAVSIRSARLRSACLVCAALVLPVLVFAQEERPLVEQWRDVLTYGIDSEVAELLSSIETQGETRLDAELAQRLASTRSRALQVDLIEYFTDRESDVAAEMVQEMILSFDEPSSNVLQAAIRYLTALEWPLSPELLERYLEIGRGRAYLPAAAAVDALGKLGGEEAAETLMGLYERVDGTDLRGAIIRALGEAGDVAAVEMLSRIATDISEEDSLRQYAADSLGRIGAPESLSTLTELLSSSNSLLRAYAISAIGNYAGEEATALLADGLRDSFWRTRVAALEGIARGAQKARDAGNEVETSIVAAVVYKARQDPERPVRLAALAALGALGTEEAVSALIDLYESERQPVEIRTASAEQLIEHHIDAAREVFDRVVVAEWEKENSRVLDYTAKTLSETEHDGLAPFFERLLDHPNYIIRIYGVRGIATNSLLAYEGTLQRIAEEQPPALRNSARAALERMGLELPDDSAEEETASDTEG